MEIGIYIYDIPVKHSDILIFNSYVKLSEATPTKKSGHLKSA